MKTKEIINFLERFGVEVNVADLNQLEYTIRGYGINRYVMPVLFDYFDTPPTERYEHETEN